jgi:hypothetical protein
VTTKGQKDEERGKEMRRLPAQLATTMWAKKNAVHANAAQTRPKDHCCSYRNHHQPWAELLGEGDECGLFVAKTQKTSKKKKSFGFPLAFTQQGCETNCP